MREIKFRAWDKYRGKKGLMLCNHTLKTIGETGVYNNEDLIWMQYTGLKDKNGVEIYEGDILERNHAGKRIIKQVIFKDGSFRATNSKRSSATNKNTLHAKKVWGAEMEIIGNIYENKDLIE